MCRRGGVACAWCERYCEWPVLVNYRGPVTASPREHGAAGWSRAAETEKLGAQYDGRVHRDP